MAGAPVVRKAIKQAPPLSRTGLAKLTAVIHLPPAVV